MLAVPSAEVVNGGVESGVEDCLAFLGKPSGVWLPVHNDDNRRRVSRNDGMNEEAVPIRGDHVLLPVVALSRQPSNHPRRKERSGSSDIERRAAQPRAN